MKTHSLFKIQSLTPFENIKNEIQILNENNPELNNESFVLFEWECVNQKYWIEEYPHLQEILIKR